MKIRNRCIDGCLPRLPATRRGIAPARDRRQNRGSLRNTPRARRCPRSPCISCLGQFLRTNAIFKAEPPPMLLEGDPIKQGIHVKELKRPSGHPPIHSRHWQRYTVHSLFKVISTTVAEGVRGAPIVNCNTGGVIGFF